MNMQTLIRYWFAAFAAFALAVCLSILTCH